MKWTSPAKLIVNRCDDSAGRVVPSAVPVVEPEEGGCAESSDEDEADTAAPVEHAVSNSAAAILVRASNRTPLRFHV
jgi:hypothetical protein